jgi:hypothetical protein
MRRAAADLIRRDADEVLAGMIAEAARVGGS